MTSKILQICKTLFVLQLLVVLNACQTNVSSDIAATPPSTSGPDESGGDPEPITIVRLADRYYVASALSQIFLPSLADGASAPDIENLQSTIDSNIKIQYGDMGSSCDYFDTTNYCGVGGQSPLFTIIESANVSAPALSQPTSLRAAYTLRAVYTMLSSSAADAALRKAISLTSSSMTTYATVNFATLNPPTLTELQRVFQLVYPGVTPSASSLTKSYAFINAVAASYGAKDSWKMAFILMLSTLLWQQL